MSVLTKARGAVLLTLIPAITMVGLSAPAASAATHMSLFNMSSTSPAKASPTQIANPIRTTTTIKNMNSSYTVSKAVYSFLTSSLGVAAGSSNTLTGTAAGSKISIGAAGPTALPLALPTGVTPARFGPSTIVIDTAANTLTLTSFAAGTTTGALKVVISHASTSTLPAADLAATVSITFSIFRSPVTLNGALTFTSGRVQAALSGSLPTDASLGSVTLSKGSSLSYTTAGGLAVSGSAIIAAGTADARNVAVSGQIRSTGTWSLAINPGPLASWTPEPGFTVAPAFSGTVTDTSGVIRFDATSTAKGTWSGVPGETVSVTKVELAGTTAPGALTAGQVWTAISGNFAGPGGTTGTAVAVSDVAAKSTAIDWVQTGTITLASTPQAVTLSAMKLTGSLSGTTTGVAQVTIESGATATVAQAKVFLTPDGRLVVRFATDLSLVGLGPVGTTGTAYWSSAPITSFADPGSGQTVAVPTGFSLVAATGAAGPAVTPNVTAVPTTTPKPTTTMASAKGTTISAAAQQFLGKLGITVGSTLTGAITGNTLTLTAPAPSTLPITLPAGDAVTFGATTITVDLSKNTLTASATATSTNGAAGTLTITIANVSTTALGADLTATLDLTGLPVLGAPVELTGTIAYTGGAVSASLTGTLSTDAVVSNLLTIQAGSMITLSTKDGFAVAGTAIVGTGTSTLTVAVTGALKDLHNWSVSVSDDAAAPSFTPVDRLSITPNFSGTLTDTAGTVTFDVTATEPVSWDAGGSVTLALNHVEISNNPTPTGIACPAVNAGDIWLDVKGSMHYGNAQIDASAEACIDVPARTFLITGTETGAFGPSNGFTLNNPTVSVVGDLKAKTATVSASALLTITAAGSRPQFPVGLTFDSTGAFVAGVGVDTTTLGKLGVLGGGGELFVASKAVKGFDPAATLHISGVQTFDLASGVTVVTQYNPSASIQDALTKLGLGRQNQVQLQANLSTTGFAMKIVLGFGATTKGAKLFSNSKATAYLNTVYLGFTAGTAGVSFTVGGTGYLTLAPVYNGGTSSAVAVTLSGSIMLSPLKFSVSFDLAGACGSASCPWTDAFGIQGLQVGEVSGSLGLDLTDPATPIPTMSFAVSNLVLPDAWGKAIGVSSGAQISLLFNVDPTQPELIFSINGTSTNPVALTPLAIASGDPNVVNQIQVNTASLVFAPAGGKDVTNQPVLPGVSLIFDATIANVPVHVDGAVSVAPPSFSANIAVGDLHIGSLVVHNTMLAISVNTSGFSLAFTGGFTDSASGISFAAAVALNGSATLAGGQISLTMVGGLPSYIAAGAALSATLSGSANDVSFTASGTANLVVQGRTFGLVNVTFSSSGGAVLKELNDDAAKVANAFRQAYGWVDYQTIGTLRALGFSASQIASGIGTAYSETAAAVMEAMGNAGYDLDTLIQGTKAGLLATDTDVAKAMQYFQYNGPQIASEISRVYNESATTVMESLGNAGYSLDALIQAVKGSIGATDTQVAAAMQYFGYNAQQTASYLQTYFGDTQAQVYNALQAIGSGGQSVLDSIAGFFNTGAYNIDTTFGLLLDVSGGSQSAGASVVDYTYHSPSLDGRYNQQWYVLRTDSGWAELVNRNSGQCLDVTGDSNGASLIQNPCSGASSQQWSLGDNTAGTHVLVNRLSHINNNNVGGRVVDIPGRSLARNTQIELYDFNNDFNQQWNFIPAIG